MVRENILGPAKSGEFIAKYSKYVCVQMSGIKKLAKKMIKSMKSSKLSIPDTGADSIHPSKEHPKAVDWVFVTDSLNFCFWSFSGTEKWSVDGYTGYYALEAALFRAIKEGKDITDPQYYSKITEEDLRHIFRSDNKTQIPLLGKRLSVLHEVGKILLEKYNGTFESCLKEADHSAEKLLKIVVDNFPCYRDESNYKNTQVSFYKRAQILVADLWNFFGGTAWGEFKDIDKMTMFADYRVPQVLVHFGVLRYSNELMEKLKNAVRTTQIKKQANATHIFYDCMLTTFS